MEIIAIHASGRKYFYRPYRSGEWRHVPLRNLKRAVRRGARSVSLPSKAEICLARDKARIVATLKLNPGYRHHARWFAGYPGIGGEDYIGVLAPSHIGGWLNYALDEDGKPGESVAELLARLDPTGIILPGRIYRVTSLRVVDGASDKVMRRAMASEGL